MLLTITSIGVLVILGTATAAANFLDCPGNQPKWYNFMVLKCCNDDVQLPNNCECFSIYRDSGFTNSGPLMPECPGAMGVRFLLYTRLNRNSFDIVKVGDGSLDNSHLQSGKPVKFIIHGFTDHAPNEWNVKMKDAILDGTDANVILVDWEKGAVATFPSVYLQATSNVRTVGAMMAKLITVMVQDNGIQYDDVHLIGHSLGAHASGMAGEEVYRLTNSKIGRISGLDPAGPSFENYETHVRLDEEDATFVDVIHTDAESLVNSGFGIRIDVGAVDFWANGGAHQPSCPREMGALSLLDNRDGENAGYCSHMRVLDYYTNSVNVCSYDIDGGCKMGYHADSQHCQGKLTPSTSDKAPYC